MVWMDKAAAAAALGISGRTLERRVKDGTLEKRTEAGRVEVDVPAQSGAGQALAAALSQERTTAAVADLAQLKVLADTLADTRQAAADARVATDRANRRAGRLAAGLAASVFITLGLTMYGKDLLADSQAAVALAQQQALEARQDARAANAARERDEATIASQAAALATAAARQADRAGNSSTTRPAVPWLWPAEQ